MITFYPIQNITTNKKERERERAKEKTHTHTHLSNPHAQHIENMCFFYTTINRHLLCFTTKDNRED